MKRRNSLRLQGYDYAEEGAYFMTVVTKGRIPLFGRIVKGEMQLNEFGRIVEFTWKDLVNHNPDIELEEFVVMPNHFHGIIILSGAGLPSRINRSGTQNSRGPAPTERSISEIMRQFKTFSAKRINLLRNTPGEAVWQRNFYDHIIRDEKDYYEISEYIDLNPAGWEKDEEFVKDCG